MLSETSIDYYYFLEIGGRNSPNSNNYTSPEEGLEPATHSDTFGLHIGAAQYDYSGSLVFGGYDKSRVIGPVTSYNTQGVIPLLDIILGVETGGSPFDFESKSGLLDGDASGSAPQSTYISPEVPYIFLPQQAIDAIVELLPVSFDETSGYYLWNTQDPQHKIIVSSPAYLGFIFQDPLGVAGSITIKVPFALLNLTLESSVSGHPTERAYFPLSELLLNYINGIVPR